MLIDIRNTGEIIMSSGAYDDINDSLITDEPVSDDTARTIASWYQSPGTIGSHLAALASTGKVDYDDLMNDISATMREGSSKSTEQSVELLVLRKWADAKFKDGE